MKKITLVFVAFCFAENLFAQVATQTSAPASSGNAIVTVLPVIVFAWIVLLVMWKNHRYNVWFEFFVALFMGLLGVQKFREKKTGLGIFYLFTAGGFYVGWIIDVVRYLKAAIKNQPILPVEQERVPALVLGEDEDLPVSSPLGLILKQNEICHFSEDAVYVEVKNLVVGHQSHRGGSSVRIMKGFYVHSGSSQSTSIRGNVPITTPGIFTITNQRVVFSGIKGAFNKQLSEITSITPYDDGLGFQFNEKHFILQMENAPYANQIIQRLLSEK